MTDDERAGKGGDVVDDEGSVAGDEGNVAGDGDFDPATELHRQLRATEELPVERTAGWHLGEAQALAAELAHDDLPADAARERAATIRELLDEFETTGDRTADDHVEAARELANRLATRSDEA